MTSFFIFGKFAIKIIGIER